jgi:phosphatidylserine/phosphatidylglycerophosphate/cardiolipin synthase-like enzyme
MMKNFEFVQSYPEETTLCDPEMRDAKDVWLEMINGAKEKIDIGQFYINSLPGEAMDPILKALIIRAKEGIKIRMVCEKFFYGIYQQSIDMLNNEGIEVRLLDTNSLTGGIMHAKYLIVDGKETFLGSQNFDYLALTQIHEIGIRFVNETFASQVTEVFEMDWDLCKTGKLPEIKDMGSAEPKMVEAVYKSDVFQIGAVFSPTKMLPSSVPAEINHIVKIIDEAKMSVLLTAMEYSPKSQYNKDLYSVALDGALRRAAARGVNVKLMVTDWCNKHPNIDYLKSISLIPNIEVKIMSIPRLKDKYIPFSRVSHCKYIISDKAKCWLGSSNFEPDYFFNSRNVSSIMIGAAPTIKLREFFLNSWTSAYASFIDVTKEYKMPQIMD